MNDGVNDNFDDDYPFGRGPGQKKSLYPKGFNKGPAEGWFHIPKGLFSSPAWRALPSYGRDVVICIASANVEAGCIKNGVLRVGYGDFQRHGLRRSNIRAGIEFASSLGFIRVQRGDLGAPSLYTLTWLDRLDRDGGIVPRTNEWKNFTEATAKAEIARVKREMAARKPTSARPGIKLVERYAKRKAAA
jgi:hypothetical protein